LTSALFPNQIEEVVVLRRAACLEKFLLLDAQVFSSACSGAAERGFRVFAISLFLGTYTYTARNFSNVVGKVFEALTGLLLLKKHKTCWGVKSLNKSRHLQRDVPLTKYP